jgi:hypothetical protein
MEKAGIIFIIHMILGAIAFGGVFRCLFQLAMLPGCLASDRADDLPGFGGWLIGMTYWVLTVAVPIWIIINT